MNTLKQIENAPKHIVLYFYGLVGAIVDDYALITLVIFCALLGLVLSSILIPLTTFFGAYFVLRLVANIADVIGLNARAQHQQAQATMQIAAAVAQSNQVRGTVVDGDLLP